MKTTTSLVPDPCPESWGSLTPEDRGHFCAACQTKVWDLSSMTEVEARALLQKPSGELCVSYRERPDGGVAYRPEPIVPANRLMRRLPAAAGLSFVLAACTPTTSGGESPSSVDEQHEATPAPGEAAPEAATPEAATPEAATPEAGTAEAGTAEAGTPEATPEAATPTPLPEKHVKGKWADPEDRPTKKGKPVQREPERKKGIMVRPDDG